MQIVNWTNGKWCNRQVIFTSAKYSNNSNGKQVCRVSNEEQLLFEHRNL